MSSDFVRRVGAGYVETTPQGERFRVVSWLEDLDDGAVEVSPLKSRAAKYFGAVEAHAAAEEWRRRLRAGRPARDDRGVLEIRVLRARLRQ